MHRQDKCFVASVACWLCVFASAFVTKADMTFFSYGIEKEFATTVSSETLARTPVWKGSDANPPVSARRAIQLANEVQRALVEDADDWRWHLASVALTPDDPENTSRWFWLVTYGAFSGGMSGPPNELHVVVLMDGTVIKPEPIQLSGRIHSGAAGNEQKIDNER